MKVSKSLAKLNRHRETIAIIVLAILALLLLLFACKQSNQSTSAMAAPMLLEGEYSRDGVTWYPLNDPNERFELLPNEYIDGIAALDSEAKLSALDGDLFLRGRYQFSASEREEMLFYLNHIGMTLRINGETVLDAQDIDHVLCAKYWYSCRLGEITQDDEIEIHLTNSHKFGNDDAYRQLLMNTYSFPHEFLRQQLSFRNLPQQIIGMVMIIVSLILLGMAAFAVIVRAEGMRQMWVLGVTSLFAGLAIIMSIPDVSLWIDNTAFNTHALCISIMMTIFMIEKLVSDVLSGRCRKISEAAAWVSGMLLLSAIVLVFFDVYRIYDLMYYWAMMQLVLISVQLVCCAAGIWRGIKRRKCITGMILLIAVLADICTAFAGYYWGGRISQTVICIYFIGFIGFALYTVPREIGASARAKELEYELQNSRVTTMISQIQPHFLYNVLTSICCLCDKNPKQAKTALIQFSEYLRTNLDSIKCRTLVSIDQELTHVRTYLNLEMMRFEDALNVEYDIGCSHFMLPPLTIQPLVENAVKHGLSRTEKNGTVKIIISQTKEDYEIRVVDNGVGFDVNHVADDGKQHVGIINVRQRLESMVNGSLKIESEIGTGTTATVSIPR